MLLDLDISVSGAGLPHPIELPVRLPVFEAGNVGVVVSTSGGIVPNTTTVIPATTRPSISSAVARCRP